VHFLPTGRWAQNANGYIRSLVTAPCHSTRQGPSPDCRSSPLCGGSPLSRERTRRYFECERRSPRADTAVCARCGVRRACLRGAARNLRVAFVAADELGAAGDRRAPTWRRATTAVLDRCVRTDSIRVDRRRVVRACVYTRASPRGVGGSRRLP